MSICESLVAGARREERTRASGLLNDDMIEAWKLFIKADAWGTYHSGRYGTQLRAAGYPKDISTYNVKHEGAHEALQTRRRPRGSARAPRAYGHHDDAAELRADLEGTAAADQRAVTGAAEVSNQCRSRRIFWKRFAATQQSRSCPVIARPRSSPRAFRTIAPWQHVRR
jgi:hypothetical protein